MKKIVTVLGARPQFIKASVVSHAIAASSELSEVLIHTGQHFDSNMSDVFFSELGMSKPDYFLDIHGGAHGKMTGRMLAAIEEVLLLEKPDIVLVYGDTNSTLAGALASAKLCIPVAHVEAGLRSFNMRMPEEVNRILTDRISSWLFTPTEVAYTNLIREGYLQDTIVQVGDVMYDVARHHSDRISAKNRVMGKLGLTERSFALVTVHRQENTNDVVRLDTIVKAVIEFSKRVPIVWPLHPRTRLLLAKLDLLDLVSANVHLIDPVGYLDMIQLEKFAALIVTDSGGVQKEAFFHKVPCVTVREETEWTELVDSGWNRIAPPTDLGKLLCAMEDAVGSVGVDIHPYGVGNSASVIVDVLSEF